MLTSQSAKGTKIQTNIPCLSIASFNPDGLFPEKSLLFFGTLYFDFLIALFLNDSLLKNDLTNLKNEKLFRSSRSIKNVH